MQKITLLLIILFISTGIVRAQKYDYNWMNGIPISQSAIIKFNEEGIVGFDTIVPVIYLSAVGSITISDNEGKMRFYTNGNYIADSSHQLMANSLGLNEGSPWRGGKSQPYFGYCHYCYQVIPDSYSEGFFYLIHPLMLQASNLDFGGSSAKTLITKIDINRNNGLGEVVYKNRVLFDEETSPIFKAVQHGNGKDWWIIFRSIDGRYYHKLLLQRDSVIDYRLDYNTETKAFLKNIPDKRATSGFSINISPSGNYILERLGRTHTRLLFFDRCTGETRFINDFYVPLETHEGQSGDWEVVLYTTSLNDQFAYAWGLNGLYQWDLQAEDIAKSRVKVFGPPLNIEFNEEETNNPIELLPPLYGPDGKLYFLKYYNHYVVHNPDERGLAARAEGPRALPVRLPLYSPNYPNYRLGPLKGSPCDSLSTSSNDRYSSSTFRVFPNPSAGPFTIELNLPEWSQEDVSVSIFDAIGRELYRHRFPKWAYRHDVDPGVLPPGAYLVRLEIGGAVVHTERVVVF